MTQTEFLTLRLSEDLVSRVREYATADHRNLSGAIRHLVEVGLKREVLPMREPATAGEARSEAEGQLTAEHFTGDGNIAAETWIDEKEAGWTGER